MTSETPAWLNAHFVEKILKNSETDESIKMIVLATEPAVGKGENYGSIMIRAKVEYSRIKLVAKAIEKKSLIFKIAPMVEGIHKELIAKVNVFEKEIKMMTTTLNKMNEILKEDNYCLSARALYTEIGDPSLLVIEDLSPMGYRMANRQAGLDLDHCILAITGLAKFHASSVALWEKDPEAIITYNKGLYDETYPRDWKEFLRRGIKSIASEVAKWSELGPSYSEKLLKLADVCYKKATLICKPKDNEFKVLNHGDFWINNMLFRYDDNGKVTDHIFVDFQMSFWTSPAIDILNFLSTSIAEDVELYHCDTIVKKYLDTLTSTMRSLHCKTKPPSMAELQKSINERELYGFLASCVCLPVVILDKNQVTSFDEMIERNSASENPVYQGLAFRKIMVRRLPQWNARGLLDA